MSLTSSDSPVEGLSEFFKVIWGEVEGFVYLPTLNRQTNDWRKVFFRWPINEKDIVQHVLSGSAQGLDVYYSPVLYKGEAPNKPGRPIKSNVLGSNVIWAEFDGASEDYLKLTSQNGDREAGSPVSGPHSAVPGPSVRVQSSNDGHEHVYWRLDDFVTDVQWIEDKNRSITYSFRSDTSGWDATQILRPPFTTNYKRDRPVTIIKDDGPSYNRDTFAPLVPPPVLVNESIVIEDLPSVEDVIAKYRWDKEHFNMFRSPTIEEGKRSAALMRMGYFCIEAGMTNTEAYAILFNADERWGKYKGRADQKKRLVDIIDRARQKHPNPQPDLEFKGLLGDKEPIETGRPLVYGFNDFLNSDVQIEWAIEDLLEIDGMGMVAAMPGVGKTQLSLQLGASAALGQDFLKWKMPKKHKMVFFSLEMSHVGLKIFVTHTSGIFSEEQKEILNGNFFIIPLGETIPVERQEGVNLLEMYLDQIQPTGMIVDSVGKLTHEELSEKTARTINAVFNRLRKKYQMFIWFIHHNRKASDNNKKPTALSDVYGNQYLAADMSAVMIMYPHPMGAEIIPVKTRYAEMKKPFVVQRSEHLTYSVVVEPQAIDKAIENLGGANGNGNSNGGASFAL